MLPDLVTVNVAFACSLASACGALFIVVNWLCNRVARRLFFLRLIAFLAIANLLTACAYIMSFVEWRILGRGSPWIRDASRSSARKPATLSSTVSWRLV